LAKAAGLEDPTREELARFDRKRKKKGSNKEWKHPHDPDARITRMKDGRTHLAHKAEHAVDLSSGALLAVTLQAADMGDTTTVFETLDAAEAAVLTLGEEGIKDVVLDKGYHSNEVLVELNGRGQRSYASEPDRGRRRWEGKRAEQKQVYANRRRLRGERNKRLQKKRTELGERSFAHLYETGGMRRLHLRGRENILKRLLVHGAGFNLALVMRSLVDVGKPRQLQGLQGLLNPMITLIRRLLSPCRPSLASFALPWVSIDRHALQIPPAIPATVAA
jgi:transposase